MVWQHGDEHHIPDEHKVHRPGGWFPADTRVHKEWLKKQADHVDNNPKELIPVLREFKDFIESEPTVYGEFIRMFEEAVCH